MPSIMLNKCLLICIFTTCVYGSSELRNQACKSDTECDYYVVGSVCDNATSVCVCSEDDVASADGSRCLPKLAEYGAACEEDVQCSTSAALSVGGVCSAGTCACASTHHYRKGVCWRSVPLHGACWADDQCYASIDFVGVYCKEESCQCRDEYYEREQACRRKQSNGQACLVDEDCCPGSNLNTTKPTCTKWFCECEPPPPTPTHSELTDTVVLEPIGAKDTACSPGYYLKNGTCVPEIGTSCQTANNSCSLGASSIVCIDDRECGCNTPMGVRSLNNRACSKVVVVFNGTCAESGQCAMFGGHSICDTSTKACVCAPGAHFDDTAMICRESRLPGDSCVINEECFALSGGIECKNNICTCVNGNHTDSSGKDCHPDGLHVGDVCTEDLDCQFNNTLCSAAGQCDCQDHYFNDAGLCKSGVGSACSDDAVCAGVTLATCSNESTCICPSEYLPSLDYSTCLRAGLPAGEECQQTDQCDIASELKQCRDGKCGCVEGAQYVLDQCYNIRGLGEKCKARAECIYPGGDPDAYICQNSKCSCQYGYQPNDNQCL